jgi:hypothetical protein
MTKRPIFFPRSGRIRLFAISGYMGGLALSLVAVAWLGHAALSTGSRYMTAAVTGGERTAAGEFTKQSVVLEDDEWMAGVKRMFRSNGGSSSSNSYSSGSSSRSERRSRSRSSYDAPNRVGLFDLYGDEDGRSRSRSSRSSRASSGTYRTVCVRLCDGSSFPVSFSTTSGNFDKDQDTCERSCTSPAKLFVFPDSETDPMEMHDINGKPYSELPNAYRYRTTYDESCACKPQPWEPASLERHRVYGLQEKSRKGDVEARNELKELHAAGTISDQDVAAGEAPRQQSSRSRRASRYR